MSHGGEGVERRRRPPVRRVDADAQHDLVVAVAVVAVGQHAADLDVRRLQALVGGVLAV